MMMILALTGGGKGHGWRFSGDEGLMDELALLPARRRLWLLI